LIPVIAPALLAGCVWLKQSEYDDMLAKDRQQQQQIAADAAEKQRLNQQIAANNAQIADDKQQIARLSSAIRYTVNSDLLFASGSWKLSRDGEDVIAKMSSQLAPGQRLKWVVNGYTDNAPIGAGLKRQGVATNMDLSQKRAEAVMAYMVTQGVRQDMVSAVGHGEDNPVGSNSTPAGRAQNRRVEITVASGS
jgi:chemotaxis protein MotB